MNLIAIISCTYVLRPINLTSGLTCTASLSCLPGTRNWSSSLTQSPGLNPPSPSALLASCGTMFCLRQGIAVNDLGYLHHPVAPHSFLPPNMLPSQC